MASAASEGKKKIWVGLGLYVAIIGKHAGKKKQNTNYIRRQVFHEEHLLHNYKQQQLAMSSGFFVPPVATPRTKARAENTLAPASTNGSLYPSFSNSSKPSKKSSTSLAKKLKNLFA